MNAHSSITRQLKVVRIGNSAGVILPKEELARLQLEVGDSISYSPTPSGLSLDSRDPDFDRQMAEARKIMKRYRNALSELAK